MKVVLDSNEFISAFAFRGAVMRLIDQAIDGEIEIVISQPIIHEVMGVLREKYDWNPYRIHDLRQTLESVCKVVEPKRTMSVLGDEPDNRILEAAEEAGVDYIITEDKAMLRINEHAGTKIVRASTFPGRRK